VTDTATLRARLDEALAARHKLITGTQVVQLSYAAGAANRMARYTPADVDRLDAYIAELRRELGEAPRRRPIGVAFR
jgi:hypothetical protein